MKPSTLSLWLVLAAAVVLPAGLRGLNTLAPPANVSPSFLPSVEAPRQREPFDEQMAADFREARPDFVVIGDSMAGSRIFPGHISRLVGGRGVAGILYPGSSVAYWYLALSRARVARVLPEILRLAEASGTRIAFIRVQRRPMADLP